MNLEKLAGKGSIGNAAFALFVVVTVVCTVAFKTSENPVELPAGLPLGLSSRPQKEKLPNIIFIMGDDLSMTDMEPYGSTQVHTANMARLAKKGLCFDNMFNMIPICARTRQSYQLHNLAADAAFKAVKTTLSARLDAFMKQQGDSGIGIEMRALERQPKNKAAD